MSIRHQGRCQPCRINGRISACNRHRPLVAPHPQAHSWCPGDVTFVVFCFLAFFVFYEKKTKNTHTKTNRLFKWWHCIRTAESIWYSTSFFITSRKHNFPERVLWHQIPFDCQSMPIAAVMRVSFQPWGNRNGHLSMTGAGRSRSFLVFHSEYIKITHIFCLFCFSHFPSFSGF